jgi:alpha-beta hydrolase superfamily lysophospholipase
MRSHARKLVADLALCGLAAAIVILIRGRVIAAMAGGEYVRGDMLVDAATALAIVAALRLSDLGLAAAFRERRPHPRRWLTLAGAAARRAAVVLIAGPLMMALAQFCPPRVRSTHTPVEAGLAYEEVTLRSDDLTLAVWDIPADVPDRPVVLIAHGLGVNKAGFLHAAKMIHDLNCHVVMFDFRAHGDSAGRVTTFGHREAHDVAAVRDWIARRYPARPVFALGYSMGGAAVLQAVAQGARFEGLVLDSTFARAEDAAGGSMLSVFGPLKNPAWHLARFWGWALTGTDLADHQPIRSMATSVSCPVLLIHGTADEMIPPEQSSALADAAGDRATLWLVPGAGHIQAALVEPAYRDRLQ